MRNLRRIMNKRCLHRAIRPRPSTEINHAARNRRDRDNIALRLLQMWQRGCDEGVRAHHVGVEGFAPLGRVVAHYEGADVGDDDVDAAACGGCGLDPGSDLGGLRHVDDGAVGAVRFVDGDVCFGARAVVDDCAFIEEGLDDCVADAFGATWEVS
jgi:hypothetical protein